MLVKDIVTTDFVNYKVPSMYIAFPHCTFKCEKECGIKCCQNSALAKQKDIEISTKRIIELFDESKNFTKAIVMCGMEPLDSWNDVLELITEFRKEHEQDIVIYTGYYKEEIRDKINILKQFKNIIVKFGRFIPDKESHIDPILGIKLMNPEQHAEKIS